MLAVPPAPPHLDTAVLIASSNKEAEVNQLVVTVGCVCKSAGVNADSESSGIVNP